jgi:hypothetical protein
MTRIVIGSAISLALVATAACSGTSSTSASPAAPSTAFSAQTLSTGAALTTLDHDRGGGNTTGPANDNNGRNDDHGNGREAQLEGAIVSIDAAHKSFVVRSTTVNVLTATVIRHGHTMLTFADLKAGDQVHVKGATNGTAIDAREIKVQNEGGDANEGGEAEGAVAGLAGTCPAITFTVGTAKTKVATNDKTSFGHSLCTDLVNGADVEVGGTVQTDGSILATRVSVGHEKDDAKD